MRETVPDPFDHHRLGSDGEPAVLHPGAVGLEFGLLVQPAFPRHQGDAVPASDRLRRDTAEPEVGPGDGGFKHTRLGIEKFAPGPGAVGAAVIGGSLGEALFYVPCGHDQRVHPRDDAGPTGVLCRGRLGRRHQAGQLPDALRSGTEVRSTTKAGGQDKRSGQQDAERGDLHGSTPLDFRCGRAARRRTLSVSRPSLPDAPGRWGDAAGNMSYSTTNGSYLTPGTERTDDVRALEDVRRLGRRLSLRRARIAAPVVCSICQKIYINISCENRIY